MRSNIHNSVLQFRANRSLADLAERRARAQGMSLSEFLRHALRRELRRVA